MAARNSCRLGNDSAVHFLGPGCVLQAAPSNVERFCLLSIFYQGDNLRRRQVGCFDDCMMGVHGQGGVLVDDCREQAATQDASNIELVRLLPMADPIAARGATVGPTVVVIWGVGPLVCRPVPSGRRDNTGQIWTLSTLDPID
eukprot:CAMPEP_0168749590 /NCGR_PEP_ID=MMETSP0724-20121128/16799_1 /TAXON_ID=265536 /ORGANISM="Amphiprora sp., Strain CCMP467" /LENGTH=142 /DNA_ID=CAMNT_0008797513 /DNA_START=291 /DNA_END=717 /DNA_ORIENTATION=+